MKPGSGEQEGGGGNRSVAVVGLGLVGGSIARRLSETGWRIGWIDPAVDEAAVHAVSRELEQIDAAALAGFDLVLLATPAGTALDLLRKLELGGAVVTSVCSVMQPLADVAAERSLRFVAGHPMAGREVGGWNNSLPTLFDSRPWFRAETGDRADTEAVGLVDRLIHDCGAAVVPIAPEEHDRYAAVASHLPQLLSSALAAVIHDSDIPQPFFGPGLRTFLRLAGSSWSMWEPVFESNADALIDSKAKLDEQVRRILAGEGEDGFEKANEFYQKLRKEEE